MSNRKNAEFSKATIVTFVGMVICRFNPKAQIILFGCMIIYFIIGFVTSLIKKKSDTPNYIFIGGLGVAIIYLLYLVGKTYLRWGEDTQGKVLVIMCIPITYLIIKGINAKLKSGDINQIHVAKQCLKILGVISIVTLLLIIWYFTK